MAVSHRYISPLDVSSCSARLEKVPGVGLNGRADLIVSFEASTVANTFIGIISFIVTIFYC